MPDAATPLSATPFPPLQAGFAPVVDDRTRVLILGSFPGVASLDKQQYYAHPRNQFWRLLSAVLGVELPTLPYPERLARLLDHGIGLWDVIDACHREGSLDSAIRNARANDFDRLACLCPTLEKICFNGKTSGRFAAQFSAAGFCTLVLPSSSPANAQFSFEQKLALWKRILE